MSILDPSKHLRYNPATLVARVGCNRVTPVAGRGCINKICNFSALTTFILVFSVYHKWIDEIILVIGVRGARGLGDGVGGMDGMEGGDGGWAGMGVGTGWGMGWMGDQNVRRRNTGPTSTRRAPPWTPLAMDSKWEPKWIRNGSRMGIKMGPN